MAALDSDLAALYGVPTKALNQAVTRNRERFPEDFMFRLSGDEFTDLRSQIVTASWVGRRSPPRAFTEHGVAMLSSVLRSKRAAGYSTASPFFEEGDGAGDGIRTRDRQRGRLAARFQ